MFSDSINTVDQGKQYKKEVIDLRQKVNKLEFNLAEQSTTHNREIGILQENIAKLNASFEKNEVIRQNLEYELALSNQKLCQANRLSKRKEEELEAAIVELKELNKKSYEIIQEKEKQFDSFTASFKNEGKIFLEQIQIKEAIILELKKENEILYEHKVNGDIVIKKQRQEQQEECKLLQKQLNTANVCIEKLETENSINKNQIKETSKTIESLNKQVKNLQSDIEQEHSTQSKLRSEIESLQITVKELNSLLSTESSRYKSCMKKLDDFTEKYRELHHKNSEDMLTYNDLKVAHLKLSDYYKQSEETIRKLKEQFQLDKDKILEQLAKKKKELSDVNEEVLIYKKNLDECQKDLAECKKKLIEAIETKDTSEMKNKLVLEDLKNVIHLYKISDSKRLPAEDINGLITSVKDLFKEYKLTITALEDKIKLDSVLLKNLSADYNAQKEASDTTIKEKEKELNDNKNTVLRLKMLCTELEEKIKQHKAYETKEMFQKGIEEKYKSVILEFENELVLKNEIIAQQKIALKHLENLNTQVLTETEKALLNGKEKWLREKDILIKKFNDEKKDHDVVLQESLLNQKENLDKTKELLQQLVEDNELLRISLMVITSGLWAYYVNNQHLLTEKVVQTAMVKYLLQFKDNIASLNATLNAEMCLDSKLVQGFTGIFKFRIIVIAVLVINRFLFQKQSSTKYSYKGKIFRCESNIMLWLNNKNFECVAKLAALSIFKKIHQCNSDLNSSDLADLVGSCLCEYCENVQKQYPMSVGTSSLIELLGNGLKRLLRIRKSLSNSNDLVSSLNLMILHFTERLHTTEIERISLVKKNQHILGYNKKIEKSLFKERTHAVALQNQKNILRDKINRLEAQLKSSINVEKNVSQMLSEALKKKEQLDSILQEQTQKIKEMTEKIDIHSKGYGKNDAHITQIMEDLQMCQVKTKQAEDQVCKMEEIINVIAQEKNDISQSLTVKSSDVEKLLRERNYLVFYLQNVVTTFHENNINVLQKIPNINDMEITLPLLPPEVFAVLNESPELQIVQKTVGMLLSIQKSYFFEISKLRADKQSMRSKIVMLEKDIVTHRNHVSLLKKQLSTFSRQDTNTNIQFELVSKQQMHEDEIFIPLRAQHDS
ncbi:uncharacterized protein LOC101236029 isoform X1 [Hydra vulgaris]|uniref:uncharacterized protein LOC101236029 isoform X1 n=1 Tax=Hydra vulgaris TaxID=6087 RepID=UPI001F5FB06D|nr:uncharacterized protein LOC101236029 isoform X1 [Hydra vulgaris]